MNDKPELVCRVISHNALHQPKRSSAWLMTMLITYPSVVMVMNDHQIPSPAPLRKGRGNCSSLVGDSCEVRKDDRHTLKSRFVKTRIYLKFERYIHKSKKTMHLHLDL